MIPYIRKEDDRKSLASACFSFLERLASPPCDDATRKRLGADGAMDRVVATKAFFVFVFFLRHRKEGHRREGHRKEGKTDGVGRRRSRVARVGAVRAKHARRVFVRRRRKSCGDGLG